MNYELSMKTRRELVEFFASEYKGATKSEKSRMIDGLMATTGYTRKHAIQVLH